MQPESDRTSTQPQAAPPTPIQPPAAPLRPQEPANQGQPQPQPQPSNTPPMGMQPQGLPPQQPPQKRSFLQGRKKLLAGIVAAVIVLAGGSAAAYFAVYLPNTPGNTLKSALENTAKQTKAKYEGTFNYESTDSDNAYAASIGLNGQVNMETGNFQGNFDVTVSGIKVPFELRKVDKSGYIRVGDLGTLKGLTVAAPEYAPLVDELSNKLSNKWIEVDQTLLKQANADCILDSSNIRITEQDMQLLQNRYKEVPFTTIKSTSTESVNGSSAIKYELELDDNKMAEYAKGLNDLSLVKKVKECTSSNDAIKTEDLADDDITPLTLWVDKDSKTIVKIASHSTQQDEEKEHIKGNLVLTLKYGEAQIDKPEGARPLMEVLGDLGPLFQGVLGSELSGV